MKPRADKYHFLVQWTLAIKGPVDHLELVFSTDNSKFTSYYITQNDVVPKYKDRDFEIYKKKYTLEWYRLKNVDFAKEMFLRTYCEQQSQRKDIRISYSRMIFSAAPFESQALADFVLPFAEETPAHKRPKKPLEEQKNITYHFCASLTVDALQQIKLLKNKNPFECTAHDVIYYLLEDEECEKLDEEPGVKTNINFGDPRLPGLIFSNSGSSAVDLV